MTRFAHLTTTSIVIALCWVAAASSSVAEATQSKVDARDVQRLQDDIDQLRGRLAALTLDDRDAAAELRGELDMLDDDVAYLRVTLRRDGSVSRDDYDRVDGRVDAFESRLNGIVRARRGDTVANEVPVGTEIDVRLQTSLHSDTAEVEDRFKATTVADLFTAERALIPAGSELRGVVSAVDRSSRTDRTSSMTLAFDRITIQGRTYPVSMTVTEAIESGGIRDEAGRVGIGAAVGGIIGGILGGGEGVLTGILIGAGGTIVATEGEDVDLPAGTVLRARFDTPVVVDVETPDPSTR